MNTVVPVMIVFLAMKTHDWTTVASVVRLIASSSLAELPPTNLEEGRQALSRPVMLMSETSRTRALVWSAERSSWEANQEPDGPRNIAYGSMTWMLLHTW